MSQHVGLFSLPLVANPTMGTAKRARQSRTERRVGYGRLPGYRVDLVLNVLCWIVKGIVVVDGIDRNQLFEGYQMKLKSYNGRLLPFLLATLPSVLGLFAAFVAFKILRGLTSVLAEKGTARGKGPIRTVHPVGKAA